MSSQALADQKSESSLSSSSVLLQSIHPTNILSFGPDTLEIPMGPLNVLIGPNGSGKSNLIEAIDLLRSTAYDIADVVRRGGGVQEWVWKGKSDSTARVEVIVCGPEVDKNIRHLFAFRADGQLFRLSNEVIEDTRHDLVPNTYPSNYRYENGFSFLRTGDIVGKISGIGVDQNTSILVQRRDPDYYTYLSTQYESFRLYRDWQFGRNTIFRAPQRADMRNDRLEEDFSNLGLFLNRLRRNPQAKKSLLLHLCDIYDGIDDFDVSVEGGTVQVFFTEGDFTIPATRLSDGTLRYLCLLAILCDPNPPPLICIEEPELGLHPDILPKIADLLIEASTRTQLIVTTHSDILVDAMTERPESVLVCEKHKGQTQIRRLSKEDLAVWLEKYRLGELWTRGDIGGTRW